MGRQQTISAEHIPAVVLAGGENQLTPYHGRRPRTKAGLLFDGRAAINYPLAALRQSGRFGEIAIVGTVDRLRPLITADNWSANLRFLPEGDSLLDNFLLALEHFAPADHVLFITADLPLVSAEAVEVFLAKCAEVPLDQPDNVFISMVPRRSFTGVYHDAPVKFLRFHRLQVCHGNILLMSGGLADNTAAHEAFSALRRTRKHPVLATFAVGWRLGLLYAIGAWLLGVVSIEQMAQAATRYFGFGVIPIVLDYPELTLDIDEPKDYSFVHKVTDE